MSLLAPVEPRQDGVEVTKGPIKCRIPQRLPPGRQRLLPNRPKPPSEVTRAKWETIPVQHQRFGLRNTIRPRSDESRPKSANRVKDELGLGRPGVHPLPRSARPDRERFVSAPRRPSTIPKKMNDHTIQGKIGRPVITVPVPGSQVRNYRTQMKNHGYTGLPDQETIQKQERCEDLEDCDGTHTLVEKESISSRSDRMMKLKISWQENMVQFEKMKDDLKERQKAIMELYALMRNTHQKMAVLGQKAILPPSDDLRIMNVAKLTAEQLLQLCSVRQSDDKSKNDPSTKTPLTVDMNKLYGMPTKLVATCEQTLLKRKEIIDWFESLTLKNEGIGLHKLSKKINEFNAENEMLKSSLDQAQGDFRKELNEIIEFMRKTTNETIALQLRTEELVYQITELNSQNNDLKKQMHTSDHLRSQSNKNKIEELEKDLKMERCKKIYIKDRLSRAEGQIKIGAERASQLEAALEQARSQTRTLERTVQQLHEQNTKLQTDFDEELNKLRESIQENTMHLEEIADAREKLQAEKDDLEHRLMKLSQFYNESLAGIKHDMNINVAQLVETKKKYEDELEEKIKLQAKVELLCAQLLESELRLKDLTKELQETQEKISTASSYERELVSTKRDLDLALNEIDECKSRMAQQEETIKEYEQNFKDSINLEESLKSDLMNKEEYISELEKKQSLLEQQLQESECKMGSYEEQLSSLKTHIAELQEDFGEFENLTELHDMVNQQRAKLLEATRQNGELAEALQKKDMELERHIENLTEQERLLEQREGVIKMLSEKDEEQNNIIKLLRNNLEMRTQADMDLNQQITEKNAEIEALISNVETRKKQISQLETILLTLEDQTRKASTQRKKDQEKVKMLEQKIAEYEAYHMENRHIEVPANNLDSIIKILEDELGTSFEPTVNSKDKFITPKKKYIGDRRRDKLENFECHKGNNNQAVFHAEQEPTKIAMDNFVKKTYISTNDDQFKGDNLNRKKAITNIDTQKWVPTPEPNINNVYTAPPNVKENNTFQPFRGLLPAVSQLKDNLLSRNIQLMSSNQFRDEKKCKMFKIAGHRL
ncbi:COP1-interactive protein 1-like isoform X2 [Trichoplusia ni]|uniref:COP1-interactive protein 1-like isoform X2 n=1 Tax=Trichoplusia ni TaxID=7111 RepID=A0A7E5X0Y3_TRINI|nr:COP1-interactive protein 1-like isoform X2 [Trichoplusia ni]